ncbi:hypothetical protein MO973_29150 [Paenibacillus sp. TRM 82003]|nr:hypothetical protein [Paenibacillus sp. TRM 82003]
MVRWSTRHPTGAPAADTPGTPPVPRRRRAGAAPVRRGRDTAATRHLARHAGARAWMMGA